MDQADAAPLVDVVFYGAQNPDVYTPGIDPDGHYAKYGWREGRHPNASFSTKDDLAANPDVAAANLGPFQPDLQYGIAEGRHGWEIDCRPSFGNTKISRSSPAGEYRSGLFKRNAPP